MSFKSSAQRKAAFANMNKRTPGLTDTKVNYLLKDEIASSKEYKSFADKTHDSKNKEMLNEMAADERKHARYIKKIKQVN